jgi:hypothetical protein
MEHRPVRPCTMIPSPRRSRRDIIILCAVLHEYPSTQTPLGTRCLGEEEDGFQVHRELRGGVRGISIPGTPLQWLSRPAKPDESKLRPTVGVVSIRAPRGALLGRRGVRCPGTSSRDSAFRSRLALSRRRPPRWAAAEVRPGKKGMSLPGAGSPLGLLDLAAQVA